MEKSIVKIQSSISQLYDDWICLCPALPRYNMDTIGTRHGFGRDIGFTQKTYVSDTILHDMLPILKNLGIVDYA